MTIKRIHRARYFAVTPMSVCFWLAAFASAQSPSPPADSAAPVAGAKSVSVPVGKPSGLAFHEKRNSILLIDNQGILVELDLALQEKNRWKIPGALEGVAVHPVTGTVFLASERAGAILEFDLDLGKHIRTITLALGTHPEFLEDRDPNKGVEGLAIVPSDKAAVLYVVHEVTPPRLLRLVANLTPEATARAREAAAAGSPVQDYTGVEKGWDIGLRSLNDLYFDAGAKSFLVTGAREKTLRVLDAQGKILRSVDLPGPSPKGFCLLPNGDALVVHEAGGGHLLANFRQTLFPAP